MVLTSSKWGLFGMAKPKPKRSHSNTSARRRSQRSGLSWPALPNGNRAGPAPLPKPSLCRTIPAQCPRSAIRKVSTSANSARQRAERRKTGEIRRKTESLANNFSPARMLFFGPNSAPRLGRIPLNESWRVLGVQIPLSPAGQSAVSGATWAASTPPDTSCAYDLIKGLAAMRVYTAIRPRLGAGPATGVIAALLVESGGTIRYQPTSASAAAGGDSCARLYRRDFICRDSQSTCFGLRCHRGVERRDTTLRATVWQSDQEVSETWTPKRRRRIVRGTAGLRRNPACIGNSDIEWAVCRARFLSDALES